MTKRWYLVLAAALVMSAGEAAAQSSFEKQAEWLEQLHRADEAQRQPVPEQKPPPATRPEKLYQPDRVYICMGIDPWQPVYAQPTVNSPVIGRTQPQVAITGNPINGFFTTLFYNGRIGYVPAAKIGPYHNGRGPDNLIVDCTFVGVRKEGQPVFRFDRHLYGR